MLCIDLLGSPTKYRIIAYYVPPSLKDNDITVFSNFYETSKLLTCDATIIVCGDFNIPSNIKLSRFSEIMTKNGFTQHVDSPTRKNNILDLVFVNDDFAVSSLNVGPPFSTSDHSSISFNIVYLPPVCHVSLVSPNTDIMMLTYNLYVKI